jgi:hypothetical protein
MHWHFLNLKGATSMKRLATAMLLMCALSATIFAGDMPSTGKSEPPPPTTSTTTSSALLANVVFTIIALIR